MKRGEYLLKIIDKKGFTLMELSKESGVAYTSIRSLIERDLVNASIDNILKICEVLDLKVDDIVNDNLDIEETVEKDQTQSKLGTMLKKLRDQNNYSQIYVANKIGVKNNTLSGYESGRREPDLNTLVRLADLYDVSVDYLLGRDIHIEKNLMDIEKEYLRMQLELYRKIRDHK